MVWLTSNPLLYWLVAGVHVVIMTGALLHALIYKRDYRAALGWVGVIVVFPVAGPVLYFIFGINRVRTRAKIFAGHHLPFLDFRNKFARRQPYRPRDMASTLPVPWLGAVGGQVTGAPLIEGNQVDLLINGEEFYPRLIETIHGASHYVLISSYIFSTRGTAGRVVEALAAAASRDVQVYVLVDGVGQWYSLRHRIIRPLRKAGVNVTLFMPPSLLPPSIGINLRNHRKITVVDGQIGFFGGMNIDLRHLVEDPGNRHPTRDTQFEIQGPSVDPLQHLFAYDWWMMTGKNLEFLIPPATSPGDVPCRVINDGPDETLDYLAMTLIAIFAAAREDITIMVPYFLPSRAMMAALQSAAIKGLRVRIVLPEKSNLRFIDWATRKMLWEMLIWDVEIYLNPPPFDHSKLIVVDGTWVLGGSANLDPRSLRLNFELGVEIFSTSLASTVNKHIDMAVQHSRRLTLEEMDARSVWLRTRDAFFWLFSGYL